LGVDCGVKPPAAKAASGRRSPKENEKRTLPHPALFIRLDPRPFYLEDKSCLELEHGGGGEGVRAKGN